MYSTKQTNKFTRFLRNNAALLLIIFCVVAITSVVLAVTLTRDRTTPVIPNNPVDGKPDDNKPDPVEKDKIKVYFGKPVEYTSISMEYTDGKDVLFVFSSTLNSWESHNAVDLVAADGTAVNAMYDGTVIEVTETYGLGHIVKVDHGDNVIATYASLGDVQVQKGQNIKKGEKIGAVSTSASYEFKDGAHLHLEITKDGKNVNPMPYVSGEIFREVEQD
ncbi:MAG: M23 family metallopeptidase [Clostridia bacterium]|nr:M23 family metallopeptidase [Clostridia bacterium]